MKINSGQGVLDFYLWGQLDRSNLEGICMLVIIYSAVVEVIIGSKVQCLFCSETSTTEGRGEEMGGDGNIKKKAHRIFDPRNNSTPVVRSSTDSVT